MRVTMNVLDVTKRWRGEHFAERVSAASYGTILVLSSLPLINPADVSSGLGWELVTGVGVATWVAHFYAEIVGDHLRRNAAPRREEVVRAMVDGLPILLAAVLPAMILGLGRLDVLAPRTALWTALVVAIVQLVGVGALAGAAVSRRGRTVWWYAAITAGIGLAVVLLKLVLGH
jgi:hypothetical protein